MFALILLWAAPFPPTLPEGKSVVTDRTDDFLKPVGKLEAGVVVAKTAPTIDFAYYPGQNYPGRPWSNWGDSLAANGKYYASIGDHLAVGGKSDPAHGTGTAFVYEYDPEKKSFRALVDLAKFLAMPKGHYTPGKIHSRLDLGSDGRLYFSTHRGSTTVTSDKNHYTGDWILATDPKSGTSEVIAHGPVAKHCIPCSVMDGRRMIFYGGTAPGTDAKDPGVRFVAYDVKNKKLLHTSADGPARCIIHSRSTGRVYWTPGKEDAAGELVRFDPAKPGDPVKIDARIGVRAATEETPAGLVYTVARGAKGSAATLFAFDVKTEKVTDLGPASVGSATYITSIDADPTGRYLYYIPGAHGGAEKDGSPVVQYDTKTRTRKVLAFLHPYYQKTYGVTPVGTFSSAIDPRGDKLYITWNANRGGRAWDVCALSVIHIPESERRP